MSGIITGVLGVTAAAVAAGGTVYAQKQAQKAAEKARQANLNGINLGSTPNAALYRPVDFADSQWKAIDANYRNLAHNNDLMTWQNNLIDQDAMRRASKMIPGYAANMRTMGNNATMLVNGQIPYSDALGVVSNRADLAGAMGVPGTYGQATNKDLGISRLDAIKAGTGMMSSMIANAEAVDPVSRRGKPQDMFVSPLDRIKLQMEQRQLIQQSQQSANNLKAGVSPTDQAAAQLAMAQRMGVVGAAPDPSAGYSSALNQLMLGLKTYQQSTSGTGTGTGTGTTASTGTAAPIGLYMGTDSFGTPTYGTSDPNTPKLSDRPYDIPA